MQDIRRLLVLTFCLLAVTVMAFGQSAAAITGKVVDPQGAAIANAVVSAKLIDQSTVTTAQTNSDGAYFIPSLATGQYEVTIEANGFAKSVIPSFHLDIGQTARFDVTMKIGTKKDVVEVTSAAPILQVENAVVGTVMESKEVSSLPLATRNYNQLALLTPGAVTITPASFSNAGQSTFNSGRPYINGAREQANYYILDGMDNNEFVDNAVAYSPNVDAIAEFNVVSSNPSADYGQFLGGVITVSTKQGTNQFHGELFEYLRNDFFNANEWSRNFTAGDSQTPLLRWNQFGGTVGGPIVKDKLFFFADYQGSRYDLPPVGGELTTLTPAEKGLDFSDQLATLVYPGTTVSMPSNLNNATKCGAGQTMGINPCITLSATAAKIFAALPTGSAAAAGAVPKNNYANSSGSTTNGDQGDIRVDWAASDKDRIFGRYSQQSVIGTSANTALLQYDGGNNTNLPIYNGVIDYTRTVSPSFVNELRFGANYDPAEYGMPTLTTNAGSGLINGQPTAYLPQLTFTGTNIGNAFGTVDQGGFYHQTVGQLDDTAIWTKGNHNIKFGFQALRYRNDFIANGQGTAGLAGAITATGQYTANSLVGATGNALVDFALGLPESMGASSGVAGDGYVGQRHSAYGAFFQDDWRVTSKLTLNLGLRYQLITPDTEVDNRQVNFNLYTGAIEIAGQNGNSAALVNTYNGIANFLPRIGIAYTPWGNNTVIRAAFSRSNFQKARANSTVRPSTRRSQAVCRKPGAPRLPVAFLLTRSLWIRALPV